MPEERETKVIDETPATVNAEVAADPVSKPDANTAAATSTAADESKTTASIVRDVVSKAGVANKAASSPEGEVKVEESTVHAERDPDDFSGVPFHKHPDFVRLVQRKNEFQKQAESFKEDATRYNNVQTFLDTNGLAPDEAANGLITLALAKTNPVKAWEQVRPWVEKLAIAAGEFLPQELQERVTAGELSRETAIELSRAKAAVASTETHTRAEADRRAANERKAQQDTIVSAVTSWEDDRKLKDPNFAAKSSLLRAGLAEIHQRDGVAKTEAAALEQLKTAYKFANDHFRPPVVQAKPAIMPVVGATAANVIAAEAGPASTLDIVKRAVANARQH